MKKILLFIFLLFFCCLLSPPSALAVSVGVKPKEFNLKVAAGKRTEAKLLIINTGKEPAFYKAYPDNFKNRIIIKPADFRLDPGNSQIVAVNIRFWRPGEFITDLSVAARPLRSSGLAAASGVKIPIIISASAPPFWIGGIFLMVCLLVFFMIKFRKERKAIP